MRTVPKHKLHFLISTIVFIFCCFTVPIRSYAAQYTTTYTYDDAGSMVSEAHVQLTDSDGDGLYDSDETARGTNPNKSDSDSDGIPDGWEVTYGLNPLTNDASGDKDYDGITNLAEYTAKTNPNKIQTDLVLKNMTITTGNTKEYRATNSITSGPAFIINSGANVTFQAGNKIKLIAGFKAQEGSKFKAYLK